MAADPYAVVLQVHRAVEQTVIAHRIEGWDPKPDDIAALNALAAGDLRFGDYLAAQCRAYPPPSGRVRRRLLRRAVPYLIPGTTVLRNSFGLRDGRQLAALEYAVTAGRMVRWHRDQLVLSHRERSVTESGVDVQVLHRELFGDVYTWAGEFRSVDIRRGESAFSWASDISAGIDEIHYSAKGLVNTGRGLDNPRLAWELARIYVRYNRIHPFREGNGRTGMLFLHALTAKCGRRLDLSGVTRADWYEAARDSMPSRREGTPSHRPFLWLLNKAVKSP
ncbi:cell filamentation protein [Mycobacterium sp. MAA66]|uniref:Fic family protein n=1 Tax=Mycobacterium sp. MAA66 TaxID=3156297 RepID=UPI0035123D7F